MGTNKRSSTVTVFADVETDEYFFSTSHGQRTAPGNFIPTTFPIPHQVKPRAGLPSGRIESKTDLVKIYFRDQKEILNPDPSFQPTA